MKRMTMNLLALLLLAPLAPQALAQTAVWESRYGSVVITSDERALLRDYYRPKGGKGLPPGLQKKVERGGELPPGWQKKLARGQVVPGDIWRYHDPLPAEILRRLPPQPDGVVTVRIDDQIVRVATAGMILLDVFDLI